MNKLHSKEMDNLISDCRIKIEKSLALALAEEPDKDGLKVDRDISGDILNISVNMIEIEEFKMQLMNINESLVILNSIQELTQGDK